MKFNIDLAPDIKLNSSTTIDKVTIEFDFTVSDHECKARTQMVGHKTVLFIRADRPEWLAERFLAFLFNLRDRGVLNQYVEAHMKDPEGFYDDHVSTPLANV
jgi:hypothetical protein